MFVHPSQVGEIARRHPAVRRARLVIERPASADEMTLMIETTALEAAAAVAATVQSVTKMRAAVSCVAPDSLPKDGRLIEDRRPIG